MLFRPLYQIPDWLQRFYAGAVWRRDAAVYLTFDDGPIPEVTPEILKILREKDAKATFFVVGDNVRKFPYLLDQIIAEGHRVGNHTFHHLPGWKTSLAEYMRDVSACDELLRQHAGRDLLPLLRPPYGRIRHSQCRELQNAGYEIILWDVLTHDYNSRYSADKLLQIVQQFTRPGSIVVFHDSLKSGERMLETLPKAIDWWRENGYELKTL